MSDRWEPDSHIVEAALSTPKFGKRMTDLSGPDRSWLVAGLTLAGMTTHTIAERLSCSLRLVKTIRADEMTQVCLVAQDREAAMLDELRKMELEYRLAQLSLKSKDAENIRLRRQLDQILDAHTSGSLSVFRRCGHPKVGYNVYRSHGREYCRECRRAWDQNHRKRA